jgi:hypothetical protein
MLNNGLGGALVTLRSRMRVAKADREIRHFVRPRDAVGSRVPTTGSGIERTKTASSSLALSNLRALVIVVVVAFHSSLAYLGSQRAAAFPFDQSPFQWRAFPILDNHRWFGFDVFCAWQDVYLMALMFFLSALFTWPSLMRKGSQRFLTDRLLRLGVPFAFAVTVVVPIALYPAYRVTAADPGVIAYARHYLALPFWPNGPMWFLWQLLVLTAMAAALHRFAPRWVAVLSRFSASAGATPGRYFVFLVAASIAAYVPLAIAFTPWSWAEHGPLALQFSRPLLYGVFYFAGLGLGACGFDRGLLATDGMLTRRWAVWLAGALASVLLWMGLTALAMTWPDSAPLGLRIVVDSSFALACASGCLGVLAGCLRLGAVRSPLFDSLAKNAFGIYLLHYGFVVWLQYALLGTALFALAKGMIVLTGALLLAWAATASLRGIPFGSWLIGEDARKRTSSRELGSRDRIRA